MSVQAGKTAATTTTEVVEADQVLGEKFVEAVAAFPPGVVVLLPCGLFVLAQIAIAVRSGAYRTLAYWHQCIIASALMPTFLLWASLAFLPTRKLVVSPDVARIPYCPSEFALHVLTFAIPVGALTCRDVMFSGQLQVITILIAVGLPLLPVQCLFARNVFLRRLETQRILAQIAKRCFDAMRLNALLWLVGVVLLYSPQRTPILFPVVTLADEAQPRWAALTARTKEPQ